ncbi:MAG: hypothetical protein E3K32_00515 [wastewater metagenome]|nr:hypothetical protein [Candidatus Loosdrechtia aerotolerans]
MIRIRRFSLAIGSTFIFGVVIANAVFMSSATAAGKKSEGNTGGEGIFSGTGGKVDKKTVEKIISGWKDQPKKVARQLIEKYGPPDAAGQRHLIWYDNGPWVETKVVNQEIFHYFPKKHRDVVTQTVKYEVPADKVDELIEFDESLIIDRTKGELSVMCHNERMNTLALNLADDIVKGKRSVQEARKTFAEQVQAAVKGQPAPLTQELRFDTKVAGTAAPGEPIMGKEVTQKEEEEEKRIKMEGREGAILEKPDKSTVKKLQTKNRDTDQRTEYRDTEYQQKEEKKEKGFFERTFDF